MTEPTEDKILNRVRGLLDKAASTEFESEAQALRDKAMQLMAAYGIEQAMLEASGKKVSDQIVEVTIGFKNPYSREKHSLPSVVAKAFSCRAVGITSGKSVLYAKLVGHASDVERVEFLFTLLLVQAENGAAKVKADSHGGWYSGKEVAARTRILRASYMAGFADEVGGRLWEIQQHAERQNDAQHAGSGTPGAALVLASRRELVDQRYADLFPGSHRMRSRNYSQSGLNAGRAGGRNADLGQNRFGTRGKALTR